MHPQIPLPGNVRVHSMEEDSVGEHNRCFLCKGTIDGKEAEFFIKLYRSPEINLPIERDLLPRLSAHGVPVPKVLFAATLHNTGCVGLTPIDGVMLWDLIDPRRALYQPERVQEYLEEYGAMLGKVHSLPIATTELTRKRLYTLSEEEQDYLADERGVMQWLAANSPKETVLVLAHGDFHTAHVYFKNSKISGVIDWESAGWGWREFDLAWILRARQAFLNTLEERQAILNGYSHHGIWDEATLRHCEVLVYLHYAFWTRGSEYEAFALGRARAICNLNQ